MDTASKQGGEKRVRILVFACRWCGGIGAERAGWRRTDLPASFRVIPVECAALVEPDAVFRALASGIDGVAVLGCHIGGCRYDEANHAALKRLELLKALLDSVGIGGERLCLAFGTAHEDHQFAGVMGDFHRFLQGMPPLEPWTGGDDEKSPRSVGT
jgi:F420-non-reducing hydrogenase iron-sulfur subunit